MLVKPWQVKTERYESESTQIRLVAPYGIKILVKPSVKIKKINSSNSHTKRLNIKKKENIKTTFIQSVKLGAFVKIKFCKTWALQW